MLRRLNIRDKLLLVLWGTALFASVVVGGAAVVYHWLSLEHRAREVMEPYARMVAVGAESAVAFQDPVRAQEVLSGLSADPMILEAVIVLENGSVLARFSRQPGTPPSAVPPGREGVTVHQDTAELESGLPHGARLHLVMELSQLAAASRQTLWLFSVAAVVLVFVTLGQTLVLRRTIVRPLAALTQTTEGIRLKADSDMRVPAEGTDEVARLGRSFNAMLEAVRARERDLKELTAFQQTILDSVASAIVSTTPTGIVTSFNPAAKRLLGYAAEEVVGRHTPVLWHLPEELAQRAAALSETLEKPVAPGFEATVGLARRGHASEGEWTVTRKDGTRVSVHLSVTALMDESGRLTGFVGMLNDLTERRRAEQDRLAHIRFLETMDRVSSAITRTNELEVMLRDVLDIALSAIRCDGAFVGHPCDPESPVLHLAMARTSADAPPFFAVGAELPMNEDMARTQRLVLAADAPLVIEPSTPSGPHPGTMERLGLTRALAMALHPKVGPPWQLAVRQSADAGPWTQEEQRLFQEMARRLTDGLSTLLAYRDQRESTKRLEEAQRIAHIGHWERDFASSQMTLAEETCRIFGITLEPQPIDLPAWNERWLQLIHPEDRERAQQALLGATSGTARYDLDYRVLRPDGEVRFVHSEAAVTRDEAGHPLRMLGMVQDITERKRAEDEVRQLNQRLEQRVAERTAQLEASNQELEAFAYSVSHDLRAPLRHINGFTLLLQKKLGPTPDEQLVHFMTTIVDATSRMERLIEDLLSFSRMARQEMSRQRVDLTELVQELLRDLEPEAKGRTVHWNVRPLPTVRGDRAMLRMALSNLLLNALKFTRQRPVAEIEIGARRGLREDELYVRDNGVGFDMKYVGKLFGVFQRLHGTAEFEGTGIGLANVRRVVSRHGGRAWAEGAIDGGATFHIALPRDELD